MSTQSANKLRSTNVYGSFGNYDTSTGSILANGTFQRNLFVGGDLVLGTETIDASGNAIDSNSNIKFTLNKVPYSIPLKVLSYLSDVSSSIQAQINAISASSGIPSTVGYITQILPNTSSTQFGNQAYNTTSTGFNNSAFGSRNLYKNTTATFNTSVGFVSMANNPTGSANTSISYNSLGQNLSGSSNTCVGLGSGTANTSGNDNCCIGQYS